MFIFIFESKERGNCDVSYENEPPKKALLNVKEMCSYLGIGQTKARELLRNPNNGFSVRIGNRFYAHKEKLDAWLLKQMM